MVIDDSDRMLNLTYFQGIDLAIQFGKEHMEKLGTFAPFQIILDAFFQYVGINVGENHLEF